MCISWLRFLMFMHRKKEIEEVWIIFYIFIDNNKATVALPTFLHCIKMPPHQGALQAQLQ